MLRNLRIKVIAVVAAVLSVALLGVGVASADVTNGTFDADTAPWWSYGVDTLASDSGQMCATSTKAARWDAGVGQNGITLSAGAKTISFDVTGTGTFKVNVETPEGTPALGQEFTVDGTETFTYDFTAAETTNAKVQFEVGGDADGHTVCFDNVSVTDALTEYIPDGGFDDGVGAWWSYETSALEAGTGALCATTTAANRWDAGVGLTGFAIDAGPKTISFDVTGTGTFKVVVETPEDTSTFGQEFTVDGTETFTYDFTAAETTDAKVLFEVGGDADGHTVCVDNLSIRGEPGGATDPDPDPDPGTPSTLIPGVNLLSNGDFTTGAAPWGVYANAGSATGNVDSGAFCGTVGGPLVYAYDAGLSYDGIDLVPGDYELSFDASTTGSFNALLQAPAPSYATVGSTPVTGTELAHYEVAFTVADSIDGAGLAFQFGPLADGASFDFCVDNIFVGKPSIEYVDNGTFDTTVDPWKVDGATSSSVDTGALCVEVPGGTTNPWDVNIHLDGLDLPAGPYALRFDASGTGGPMRALVGLGASPYTVYAETADTPSDSMAAYEFYFTLDAATDNGQIAFQVGGATTPWTFCVDNVSLASGGEAPAYSPDTGSTVRVNQYGYEATGPKHATLVSDDADGVAWELHNGAEATVASGTSTPLGVDASAGVAVHDVDFTSFTSAGTYTLVADGQESYPFIIGTGIYAPMQVDALNYFYLARSGIDIDAAIVGADYARAAGHVSTAGGSDTNQGDNNVACQPVEESLAVYGEPWTCDYTLDVVGGWYDAGDHGKYVVNGGIATAQLLSVWERALRADAGARAALGDGSLNLPEANNGVPDVLDEAKWQLDFMMSMTVPDGEDMAGMVHHKIHDYGWTGLPLMPANDAMTRYLHRPSTAATLNLAATAAQGSRLWDAYDAEYADTLLASASKAWDAAVANPAVYAPAADGDNGGGPYDDDDVADEFYWAAAELYLTTGEAKYLDYLEASPVHTANSFLTTAFSWGLVDALAKMDLATVASDLPDRAAMVSQVKTGAQGILAVQQGQEFGLPLADEAFVWGSNSAVLNNIVVLGAGYDVTGDAAFLDAAQESMDYLLGRNVLDHSYVTGYGTAFSKNQHSRWFAHQLNAALPHPPKGSVAGGPNQDIPTWDPTFQALYPDADCAAQACYVDDIQSWATNEITVNWNSALSAASAFLAAPEARVEVADPGDGTDTGGGGDTGGSNDGDSDGTNGSDAAGDPQESDLTDATGGNITVPATAVPGETIAVGFGSGQDGESMDIWIFSTPQQIASVNVTNDEAPAVIPVDIELGEHRIAAYDSDGEIYGWADITIVSASDPGNLSATGANIAWTLLVALTLVGLGGALVIARRLARSR